MLQGVPLPEDGTPGRREMASYCNHISFTNQ